MNQSLEVSREEPTTSVAEQNRIGSTPGGSTPDATKPQHGVTGRAFVIGFFLTAFLAWFNCFMATKYNVHAIGGIQMPFGALAILTLFTLGNLGLRKMTAKTSSFPFSPAEMLTIYSMMVFGALISTPGCDNVFLVAGPVLFYFSSPENGWAQLFYRYVPSWFSPGWDGQTYKKDVIDPIYLGQVPFNQIPWSAWTMMLIAWGIFFIFLYGLMFFTALLFRKQWTQREALAFPLVEVPTQMVDAQMGTTGAAGVNNVSFWANRMMWAGFVLAAVWHLFYGMNTLFPDWPVAPVNQVGGLTFLFSERPLDAIPQINAKLYLGAIGLAYLLTREVSFSFWFFFLASSMSYAFAVSFGQQDLLLSKSGIMGKPDFIIYQAVGGWAMMAFMLIWTARSYLMKLGLEAFTKNRGDEDEPFSPRFMVFGFLICFIGLVGWSHFAGINILVATTFFAIFLLTSLVITRIVIEGGFLFPQPPFYALQVMNTSIFGTALDAANMTKLSFLQPMMLVDMRTSLLPAFLNTMKFADIMGLDRKHLRRLLLSVLVAIALTMVVTVVTSLQVLYSQGGLAGYTWFSRSAAESTFNATASTIKNNPGITPVNWGWIVMGASLVWMMMMGRSRFLWFPFHPLGYLVAPTYPITQLWFPMFVGWLTKTLVMKYGGSDSYVSLRPFMIGLILGNAATMIFWTLLVFYVKGTPIGYWSG